MAHGSKDPSPSATPTASLMAHDVALDAAPDAVASPAMVVPLWNRILDRLSLRASTAGIAITLFLVALVALREAWLGRLEIAVSNPGDVYTYISVVEAMLIGYLVAARVAVARAGRATLDALADVLDLSPAARARRHAEIGCYPLYRFQAAGYAAAALALLTPMLIRDATFDPWNVAGWSPELTVRRSFAPVVGWLFGTYLLATVREASRVSELARNVKSIDLFGCETLVPFSHFGLHVAFQTIGLVSISTLMISERGFGRVVVILFAVAVAAAAAGLLLPLRGLRDRISAEKGRELACCREALRRARDAMLDERATITDHRRISEVVAYKQLVESIDEWPIDTPTVLRACGYFAIPVISWFSGTVAPDTLLSVFGAIFH